MRSRLRARSYDEQARRAALKRRQVRPRGVPATAAAAIPAAPDRPLPSAATVEELERIGGQERIAAQPRIAQGAVEEQAMRQRGQRARAPTRRRAADAARPPAASSRRRIVRSSAPRLPLGCGRLPQADGSPRARSDSPSRAPRPGDTPCRASARSRPWPFRSPDRTRATDRGSSAAACVSAAPPKPGCSSRSKSRNGSRSARCRSAPTRCTCAVLGEDAVVVVLDLRGQLRRASAARTRGPSGSRSVTSRGSRCLGGMRLADRVIHEPAGQVAFADATCGPS